MLINFKGQVQVKVKKGQADQDGNRMMDQLAEEVEKTILQFLRKNKQTEAVYSWQVSPGKSVMKI